MGWNVKDAKQAEMYGFCSRLAKMLVRCQKLPSIAAALGLFWLVPGAAHAQLQPAPNLSATWIGQPSPAARTAAPLFLGQSSNQSLTGAVSGTIVDSSGAAVSGAHVNLSREGQPSGQTAVTDEAGQFTFVEVVPGPFVLSVSLQGFTAQTYSGTVHAGETVMAPPIGLTVASASSQIVVSLSREEEVTAEIKEEEKQRVLGVLPNFYVTYNPTAAPLSSKQKFGLAWKSTIDPMNFGVTAAIAGIEQATNDFSGYGQGAQGYAKRFGAAYADFVSSTFIGSAILPSLLKQDPRYFYKGTGTKRSRILYALANAVICKGDNGKWQPNYSGIVGGLAAAGISNAYYPASNRDDATLTFENAAIGIGATAASNLLQEFVIKKLTPHAPNYAPPPTQQP